MAEWDRDRERYEPERDLRRDYIRPGLGYGAADLRHGRSGEFSGGVWSTTVGGRPRRMHGDPDRAPQGPHAGKGPRGYRRPDARILEDVSDALTADPDVDASDVEVTVEAGEVTLAGTVPERSMRWLAEEVVSRCAGVKDVQNRLRLSPPRAPA
jgi:hypothetical protein